MTMNGILAKKLGMTQVYLEDGRQVAVTVLQAGPCKVIQRKTEKTDGYEAIQVGFEDKSLKHTTQPMQGHFKKAGVEPMRYLAEFQADNPDEWEVGKEYTVSVFEGVKQVDVTGVSKGHGFAGTIKRHNFGSGPRAHGSKNQRAPGSLSAHSYPARVFPGKRLGGRMGTDNVTVRNLELVKIDAEQNLLFVKGAVPGPVSGLIKVRKA
ncbi:MAG: 50S ribosomal protein L3 [Fibrobacterales bacterium]|nr:50S ribosomal protein L3 [Fibrobacterales bacterium]